MISWLKVLLDFLISTWWWFAPWRILMEFQRGVVLRLGLYHRTCGPGWVWVVPFGIEEVLDCNVVPTTSSMPIQATNTLDQKGVLTELVILWKISAPKKFLLEVEDIGSVLTDVTMGIAQELLNDHTWEEIQSAAFRKLLREEVKRKAKVWGVSVMNVQFQSLQLLGLEYGCIRVPDAMTLMQ